MKKYKKEDNHSYTLGVFPSIELLHNKPNQVIRIIISTKLENEDVKRELAEFCNKRKLDFEVNDSTITRLSNKENCYVIVAFDKYKTILADDKPHVVLVNPSNTGNIGNITRTLLGFGIKNIAIIKPAVDIFDPKSIRASMGAVFSMNIEYFDNFEQYEKRFPLHEIYPFMLQSNNALSEVKKPGELYSLVFGNESSGLPEEFLKYQNTTIIKHSEEIDSLNLTIAIGIAAYEFSKESFKI